tara:strand:- start:946 stop:1461 length:516 start_codon:yes stop_codon:yes gene_type:complete
MVETYNTEHSSKTNIQICRFIVQLIFASLGICWLVFGIIFVVNNYHDRNQCSNSHLWWYVLFSLLLPVISHNTISGKNNNKDDDDSSSVVQSICPLFINIGFVIWGGIEIYDKACDDLINTNIWIFSMVTFWFNLSVMVLILIIAPISGYIIYKYKTSSQNDSVNNNVEHV